MLHNVCKLHYYDCIKLREYITTLILLMSQLAALNYIHAMMLHFVILKGQCTVYKGFHVSLTFWGPRKSQVVATLCMGQEVVIWPSTHQNNTMCSYQFMK